MKLPVRFLCPPLSVAFPFRQNRLQVVIDMLTFFAVGANRKE